MTCHPAATVNCGFVEGLPVGFQIIEKPNADGDVFVCAATVETAVSLTDRWPNI